MEHRDRGRIRLLWVALNPTVGAVATIHLKVTPP